MAPPDSIEETAARWLIRLDGEGLTADEQGAFDEWLNASIRHQTAFLRLRQAWHQGNRLSQLRPLDGTIDANLLAPEPFWKSLLLPRLTWPLAGAVTGIAVMVIGAWLTLFLRADEEYRTGVGDSQMLNLEDGSQLVLNTNSRVRVRLGKQGRLLWIEQGEALFKVAHDPARPFDVHAGGTTVRAVGTAFAVRRSPDNTVDVIVAEGTVALDPRDDAEGDEWVGPASALLTVGAAATITPAGVAIERLTDSQLEHRLAWTAGVLWFDEEPLLAVAAEFNRYNRRQLLVADPAIANLRIGGSFAATDLDSFVAALESLKVKAIRSRQPDGSEVVRLIGATTSQSM